MDNLKLKLLDDGDIPLMETWLHKEHVKKWYGDPDSWLAEIKGRNDKFKFIKHFMVLYEGLPIGFCQYYPCSEANEDWYGNIPLIGSYSIDYLIGEEKYLGQGIGKAIVGLLIEKIFSLKDSKRIIVKPEKENKNSCQALLANGFMFDAENKLYFKNKEGL